MKKNIVLVKNYCGVEKRNRFRKKLKTVIKKICPKIIFGYYKRFKELEAKVFILHLKIENLEKTILSNPIKSYNSYNYDTIVLCPFSLIDENHYGGLARVRGIYSEYSKFHKIKFISPYFGKDIIETKINDNLIDVKIPLNDISQKKYDEIGAKTKLYYKGPLFLYPENIDKTFINTIAKDIKKTKYIFFELPYLFPIFKQFCTNKIVYFGSHNVELNMAKELIKLENNIDLNYCSDLLNRLEICEKECCFCADVIGAISSNDAAFYISNYEINKSKIIELPGGTISKNITFCDITKRSVNKNNAGLLNCKIGVFIGSNWGPNIEAVQNIIKISKQTKEVIYVIIGSVCDFFKTSKLPCNIVLVNQVLDETKNKIFGIADFAINLVDSGSGINMKLFDYMAAGVPIISNSFGMRGIDKSLSIIVSNDKASDVINSFNYSTQYKLILKAYDCVKRKYDFNVIAKQINERIKKC